MKYFFSKYGQIRRGLRIRRHLMKKSLEENFIFCEVCYEVYSPSKSWNTANEIIFRNVKGLHLCTYLKQLFSQNYF